MSKLHESKIISLNLQNFISSREYLNSISNRTTTSNCVNVLELFGIMYGFHNWKLHQSNLTYWLMAACFGIYYISLVYVCMLKQLRNKISTHWQTRQYNVFDWTLVIQTQRQTLEWFMQNTVYGDLIVNCTNNTH